MLVHFWGGGKSVPGWDGAESSEIGSPAHKVSKRAKSKCRYMCDVLCLQDYLFPDGMNVREYADGVVKKINPDGTYETVPSEYSEVLGSVESILPQL